MQAVGVEAVVEGLSQFQSGMGKMDSLIKGLIPGSNLLSGAFEKLGSVFESVASFAANVLAHALGELLADAVEWVTKTIMELIEMSIEAGNEFQRLTVRLDQMNFNQITKSTDDFTKAMAEAEVQTKEQLRWIQELSVTTPFDVTAVSDVYSMARAYDFADAEARRLTESVTDFTAGMGLSGVEMERIIRNFGQMQQQGKVTGRELTDLARGALVPVNTVLDAMKEKTGLTGAEFDKFRNSIDGVNMFIEEFQILVDQKFSGAARKMGRTFAAATLNLKEFFSSFAASEVVMPILDLLGGKIADLNDELAKRLPQIISNFSRIGDAVVGILSDLFGLGPSASTMADGFVGALDSIASWLEDHQGDIVRFFDTAYTFINDTLIPKIKELKDWLFGVSSVTMTTTIGGNEISMGTGQEAQIGFLEKVQKIFQDLQPLVQPLKELFAALMEVAGAAFDIEFGDLSEKSFAENVKVVAEQISKLAKWISENKDEIAEWVVKIGEAIALAWALAVAIGVVWETLKTISFLYWATSTVAAINFVIGWFTLLWTQLKSTYESFKAYFVNSWNDFWSNLSITITQVIADISNGDWAKAGEDVLKGIGRGLTNQWNNIKALVTNIANSFIERFKYIFGISSPSTVMEGMGKDLMDGLINGMNAKVNAVIAVFSNLKALVLNKLNEMKTDALNILSSWRSHAVETIEGMRAGIASAVASIKAAVVAKFNEIKTAAIQKIMEMKNAAIQKFAELKAGLISKLQSTLTGFDYQNFLDAGKMIITKLVEGVTGAAGELYTAIYEAVTSAWAAVSAALTSVAGDKDVAPALASALTGSTSAIVQAATKTMEQVIITLKAQFSKADLFSNFGSAIASRFESRVIAPLEGVVENYNTAISEVDAQLEEVGAPLSDDQRAALLRDRITMLKNLTDAQYQFNDAEVQLVNIENEMKNTPTYSAKWHELEKKRIDLIYARTQAQWKNADAVKAIQIIDAQLANVSTEVQRNLLLERRNQLLEEQRVIQADLDAKAEKMAKLQRMQENLAFLKAQFDLIDTLRNAGIDPATVLGGFTLGLEADVEGLLDLMSNALKSINKNISTTLETTDWSAELPTLADATNTGVTIGTNLANGIVQGITSGANAIYSTLIAATSGISAPVIGGRPATTTVSATPTVMQRTNNYNLSINTNAQTENVVADFAMMASLGG